LSSVKLQKKIIGMSWFESKSTVIIDEDEATFL